MSETSTMFQRPLSKPGWGTLHPIEVPVGVEPIGVVEALRLGMTTAPPSSTSSGQGSAFVDTGGPTDDDASRHIRPSVGNGRVVGMQKWEGRIVEIDDDVFTAELAPLENAGPTLIADFPTKNLGSDDAPVASPGDIVYVTVRTVCAKGRGPTVTSAVRLRRLGQWTRKEVDRIEEITRRRMRSIAELVD